MPDLTNQDYLRSQQYKDGSNLQSRCNLHALFNTNPYGWFRWVFDHYTLAPGCRVLELGCGTGEAWRSNQARIPHGCEIVLSDFSSGMLDQARQNLAGSYPFQFEVIDAQSIPYEDHRFDVVIANHMLYHVPDRTRALTEIRRVLKPGGFLYTTTVGETHLKDLFELPRSFDPDGFVDHLQFSSEFTLENGEAQLRAFFDDVRMFRYPDSLHITETEPLIDYIFSTTTFRRLGNQRAELTEYIERERLARGGAIDIAKDSGIFISS